MQNIIVFISPNITPMIHDRIANILLTDQIQITKNIDEATVIIEKDDIKKSLDDIFMQLKTKPFELHIYPIEKPVTEKDKTKHFIQRNVNIKQFNTAKQFNKQTIFNRYKHR